MSSGRQGDDAEAVLARRREQGRFVLVTYTVAGFLIFGAGVGVLLAARAQAAEDAARDAAARASTRPLPAVRGGWTLSWALALGGALAGGALGYRYGARRARLLLLNPEDDDAASSAD